MPLEIVPPFRGAHGRAALGAAYGTEARRLAMTRLDMNAARCEALFSSGLQESDAPTAASVAAAISAATGRPGVGGCVRLMAQEFGDHPEAARDRMRWARLVASELFAAPAAGSAADAQPAGHAIRHAA
jgi:hypothetical protein